MNTPLRLIVAFAAMAFLCDETRAFPFGQGSVSKSLKQGAPNGVTFANSAFGDSLICLLEKELKLNRFIAANKDDGVILISELGRVHQGINLMLSRQNGSIESSLSAMNHPRKNKFLRVHRSVEKRLRTRPHTLRRKRHQHHERSANTMLAYAADLSPHHEMTSPEHVALTVEENILQKSMAGIEQRSKKTKVILYSTLGLGTVGVVLLARSDFFLALGILVAL